jgi:hypothetical protein
MTARKSTDEERAPEAGEQIEFPLAVAVCAWCRPKSKAAANLPVLSHGICPRHLRKMRSKLGLPQRGK